ncbi:uncharacterized protein Z519_00054 [Cladophialophora bantiana CBS 173.52]|uniref:galacturonan 1,4-alpha-galacturonidase n=1 Tax=Cladophialophora bantiana (strain ATCC 10958 / CBS 173.52 / CDC B-1940 / NIH 8579) TaxID=1442370 RepID=A0A0D2INQ9_CLAB1|nr:uncharacterized protein Z519_00054 [Cladophialophora bantiana CBS 173.52]KIW98394.1 hypothetical protein Z519_00054 [Cladophialophora bantiana CBS 173.52]
MLTTALTLLCALGYVSSSFAKSSPSSNGSSTVYFRQAATTSAAFPYTPSPNGLKCIVTPLGRDRDDSSQILAAVQKCGINGTITLPALYVYTISRRMHMNLQNARLEIFVQNQSTGWIVEGNNFEINGDGWMQGGVNGNGQAWMTHAAGHSNQFGRPIVISIFNSSNVIVTNFSIRQPMFWSFWIQDSYNVEISKVYINGTNTDPYGNSSNYETNIDGLDSLRVDHLLVRDWQFHGGDDCLAPKGNTTNMVINNMTCAGGGIAFGSICQYVDSPDYIFNVTATNISVSKTLIRALGELQYLVELTSNLG